MKTKTEWVPLFGEFDSTDANGEVVFRGRRVPAPEQVGGTGVAPSDQASIGLALCNETIADCTIAAEMEFSDVTPETICELAVSYDANADHLVTAGLGGPTWGAYGIREYGGPKT